MQVELPDLANKNTRFPVKFEFQINKTKCLYKYVSNITWDMFILKKINLS